MRCAAFFAAAFLALPALAFDYGEIPLNKAVRSNGDGEVHYFYEKDHIAHLAEKGIESTSTAKRRMNHEVGERSPQDELLSDVTPVYNDGSGLKAFGGAANDA